jgi:ATP-dependent helicase/nuclease subunit B
MGRRLHPPASTPPAAVAGAAAALERTPFVVPGSIAARQWEALLAEEHVTAGHTAWVTPPLIGFSVWSESLWDTAPTPRAVPLTANQSLALWERVIAESDQAGELLGERGAAAWATAAWALLCHWGIDPSGERAGPSQRDFGAFLGWCRRYRAVLEQNAWVDHALVARDLPKVAWRTPERVAFADIDEPSPAQRELLEELARRGCRIEHRQAPVTSARRRAIKLADAADELRTAIDWARTRLESRAAGRIAIVVTGLADRRIEIERALGDRRDGSVPIWYGGAPAAAAPRIGAALDGIRLGTSSAGFETFSRWLRSPFFGAEEIASRARLEREARKDLRSQLPFTGAYRDTSLRDLVRRLAPIAAASLDEALEQMTGIERATPSGWTRAWQRSLTRLGWDGAQDLDTLQSWQIALDDFVRLTPIVGELTAADALAKLERVLEQPVSAPMSVRGIHFFADVDDVGPGYDAAWVTGFTDAAWPEPARANPLLPRALQRAHGMPWSTPQDSRDRCARRLARLASRVAMLIASWPARVYDYETEPSPAIREWGELRLKDLPARRPTSAPPRRETVADPPPPFAAMELRGGAGLLRREARCPLRAFCEDRLGARALERVGLGLNGRLRGIATHRALERLLEDLPEQTDLRARTTAVGTVAERALAEIFGDARRPLRALFAIEVQRLAATLSSLIELDLRRADFRVAAVEQQQELIVAGRKLRVRIDRVDRLTDGTLAIIDYKTGERASSAEWFKERLRDVQVPLYAAHSAVPVGAAAVARVRSGRAAYSGYWSAGAFPARPSRLPADREWSEQISAWRIQIERLVRDFVAGDTRLFIDDLDEASGAFAPLTRVQEQLGLARGWVPQW